MRFIFSFTSLARLALWQDLLRVSVVRFGVMSQNICCKYCTTYEERHPETYSLLCGVVLCVYSVIIVFPIKIRSRWKGIMSYLIALLRWHYIRVNYYKQEMAKQSIANSMGIYWELNVPNKCLQQWRGEKVRLQDIYIFAGRLFQFAASSWLHSCTHIYLWLIYLIYGCKIDSMPQFLGNGNTAICK